MTDFSIDAGKLPPELSQLKWRSRFLNGCQEKIFVLNGGKELTWICGLLLFIATKYICALCAFSWNEKDFDCNNAQFWKFLNLCPSACIE